MQAKRKPDEANPYPNPNPNQAKRKPDEALRHLRESLKGREEILGARHQNTLETMGHLAECLHEQGRLGAALSAMSKAATTALEVLGANDRLTRGLRAKEATIAAELEKERRSKSGESSSDEDDSDRDEGGRGRVSAGGSGMTANLSAEGLEALLRVLNRKNEELLVIFSNADLDHTSTIDKVEFALSLRSMGVRHVASIFEIMPVFGYTNGSSDIDLYELLAKA